MLFRSADGSMCRVALAALASGHLSLTPDAIENLAMVMREECLAPDDQARHRLQSSPDIAARLDRVLAGAEVSPSPDGRRLVFIGDLLHDRYSNNKAALAALIRKLSSDSSPAPDTPGVVFIMGNHDAPALGERALVSNQAGVDPYSIQWGAYAARPLSSEDSGALIRECFARAWFDRDSGVFYSHNGIQPGANGAVKTAFGTVHASTPEELESAMNLTLITGGKREDVSQLTNFRPDEDFMSRARLGDDLGEWQGAPVFFAHGHSGNFGLSDQALHLNARDEGRVKPISVSV